MPNISFTIYFYRMYSYTTSSTATIIMFRLHYEIQKKTSVTEDFTIFNDLDFLQEMARNLMIS